MAEALVIACHNGTAEIVSDLLQSGESPDSLDREGRSGLVIASSQGNTEIAELLLRYGATVDMIWTSDWKSMSPLIAATTNRSTETIQLLLSHGAKVDLQINGGMSALMVAVKQTETVQLLLEHGAQVDLQDNDGGTALMQASKGGFIDTIRVLLKKNAQIDLVDNHGLTALIQASCHGHTEAVRMLLEHGAQVDLAEETNQQTPLILASIVNRIESVQLLLDHGANVNWRDIYESTALIYVAKHNKSENVTGLLSLFNQEYDDKWSSQSLGSSELLKLLLDHGAEVDLQDNGGLSALMAASSTGNVEMVKLLLEHNAQVHLVEKNDATALTIASAFNYPEIVRLLIGKKENDTEKKATLPSDNKESSEVNHPLPAVPVRHTEIPQLPSTIKKEQKKPATTTDAKLPCSKTDAERKRYTKVEEEPTLILSKVYTMLKLLACRWYEIGVLLEMEPGRLDTIRTNNPADVEVCLMCMIREWLNRMNPRPTWEKLVEATKDINERKSEEIRLRYCT